LEGSCTGSGIAYALADVAHFCMKALASLRERFDRPWMADLGVFLLYTLLSVVFTWPLATELAGLAPAHFDAPFTAWRMGWIAHQIGDPGHLFDGNIFWPDRRTLAYSDAILLQGFIGAPFAALGFNPNGIANALILVGLVTSAFFAYLLAARLTGNRGAAIVAGLVFAFSSYRRVHLPHLELQWAQWMPLALWAWHRLLDTGRMRDGLLCAGAVLLQLLSSLYYAVFLAIGLAVVGAVTLIARRGRLAAPALVGLCGGAVIAAGVALSYAQPYAYARARVGDRSLDETRRYSATPASFLTVSPDSVIYRPFLPHDAEGETELFPGITPVVLAGAALVPPTTATAVAYGLSLGVAGDLSLGTNGLTFSLAREHISALRALRAPARLAILVQLALGVLAAMGLARSAARWPRVGPMLITASACLVMIEYANGPLNVQRLPVRPPPIYAWLATQPKLVTLELPAPPPHELPLYDPFYMYMSTWHWQPLVNGYSGHYSARYLDLLGKLGELPGPAAAKALTEMRVQRIVVHGELFPAGRYPPLIARLEADPMFHLETVSADHVGEVRVYAFLPGFGQ
jgi:hypothetical protein